MEAWPRMPIQIERPGRYLGGLARRSGRWSIASGAPRALLRCVISGPSWASFGRRWVLSDGKGQFIEGGTEPISGRLVDGDLVVAAAEILNESVTSGKDAGGPESLEAAHRSKPGFESAMVGPSTRLFAYCSVVCMADGISSSRTLG